MMKHCRICFECDQERSALISPCDCRGSSLYIHVHCLDQWQETALHSHMPERATTCPICKARYRHPSWYFMFYRRVVHLIKYHVSLVVALSSLLWLTCVIIPLKIFIHAVLVMITLPFGSFSLNGASLTWIGYEFPPQLALVHDSNGQAAPGLRPGVLLVASTTIPATSIFYKAVILVLEHSAEFGSKGVVINCVSQSLKVHDYPVGSGGPVEQEICTVVHTSQLCSRYSFVLNEKEKIFVAECENAYPTLRQLAHIRNRQGLPPLSASAAAGDRGGVAQASERVVDVRVLRGTCAWMAHQLDGEVLAGRWHVVPGNRSLVFATQGVTASGDTAAAAGRQPSHQGPGHSLYGMRGGRQDPHTCDTKQWEMLHEMALAAANTVSGTATT